MDDEAPPEGAEEEAAQAAPSVPLAMVVGRIVVVSGMGFAAALAVFFLVGGLWLPGAASAVATVVFLALMFLIERGAEKAL